MGSSHWNNDFYNERETVRKKEGKSAFEYHDVVSKAPAHERKVHAKLNPHKIMRESRDSAAHPESLAIGVVFDVTGSMASIPVVFQTKLKALMTTLLERKYVKDPQILMGAVGDAVSDGGSLQIGQFESGIEMDEDLGRMWLEGGGGGSMEESYQNALYFFARHTSCDCFEKRNKRGYLFLMGDELPYGTVRKAEVQRLMGDTLQQDIPIEAIVKEVQERYHVFFIIPTGATNADNPRIYDRWAALLGPENVIAKADPASIVETIAMAIGLCEGTVNIEKAQEDLHKAGADSSHVNKAAAALTNLAKKTGGAGRTARL